MIIEKVPVSELKPARYNPRVDLKPGDPRYEKLKRSLDGFGLVEPIVWNKRTGNVVGGHQRLKILVARGDVEVDCSIVDLPPNREKVLNIALNKNLGAWDQAALESLLDELTQDPEISIEDTGFDQAEVDAMLEEVDVDSFFEDATAPGGDGSGDGPEPITCPNCGHEFVP